MGKIHWTIKINSVELHRIRSMGIGNISYFHMKENGNFTRNNSLVVKNIAVAMVSNQNSTETQKLKIEDEKYLINFLNHSVK